MGGVSVCICIQDASMRVFFLLACLRANKEDPTKANSVSTLRNVILTQPSSAGHSAVQYIQMQCT